MNSVAIVGSLLALSVVVGCGGAADSGGSVIMNGGGGAGGTGTAGTGFTPLGTGGGGTAGVGGTATAGHGGTSDGTGGTLSFGGTSSGGTFNSGGSGGQAPAGTPGYPMGKVALCFGPGCPLGECDDSMFFSDTPCASVYPSDVGPSSTYCNAAETDTYCMETSDAFGPDYSVDCANGVATVLKCSGGCGNLGTGRWICQTF